LTGSGYLAGCIISLFAHEAGHICTARVLGIEVKRIGITWRGPYIVREAGGLVPNAIVSAAGPLVNLALSAILWHAWPTVALANLVLGLANLVPTATSDGGRVLRGLTLLSRYSKPQPE
jgi:Zn-dependent protease